MADASKREEIQKILSSLLVSCKESLTIKQLDKDYEELEGEPIPWRELGHISLLSFLQSIPRHVRVENRNGTYIAVAVVSDKNKHVNSLVCRQRVSKKPVNNRRTFRPSQYFPQVSIPKSFFPADLLKKVIHLVNQNPQGVHLNYILYQIQLYYPTFGISLSDLIVQLRNISHQVTVKGNYVYSVEKKVQAQSSVCPSNNLPTEPANKPELPREVTTIKVSPAGDEDDEAEEEISYKEDIHFTPAGHALAQREIKNCDGSKKSTSSFIQETISKYQIQQSIDMSVPQDYENEEANGIEYKDSQVEYDQRPTVELNYTDYRDNTNYSRDESICDIVNPRTLFRLEKLIQMHPDGIWCADLPKLYIDEYEISLNYTEIGFTSVCDFAAHLPNIFHCVQPCKTGDYILFDAKHPVPELEKNERPTNVSMASLYYDMYEEDTDAIPMTLMSENSQKLIPDGAMSFGESVGQVSVTELGQGVKCYEEVLIAEVFTPSCFWVQLRKKQSKFSKLMSDIHNFYAMRNKNYVIPPVILEKGLNCACVYDNAWHRAIIKSVKPNGYVTVLFYDFGTLKTYPPEELYFLHRSFSYMPAQAIPCGLYNVKPCSGTQWTRGASCEFLWKTEKIPLIAIIVSYDVENNSMLVSLVDTEEDDDLHINDWMVQENLAVYGSMVCIRPRNFTFKHYLLCEEHKNSKKHFKDFNTDKLSSGPNGHLLNISKLKNFKESLTKSSECKNTSDVVNSNGNIYETSKRVSATSDESMEQGAFTNHSESESIDVKDKKSDTAKQTRTTPNVTNLTSKDTAQNISTTERSITIRSVDSCSVEKPDPENDANLSYFGTFQSMYGGHGRMEHINWSAVLSATENHASSPSLPNEALSSRKETLKFVKKKQRDIIPAKRSFVNMIDNSIYAKLYHKDMHWSPSSKIEKHPDNVTSLLRMQRKKNEMNDFECSTLSISREVLQIMRGNKKSFIDLSEQSSNNSVKIDMDAKSVDRLLPVNSGKPANVTSTLYQKLLLLGTMKKNKQSSESMNKIDSNIEKSEIRSISSSSRISVNDGSTTDFNEGTNVHKVCNDVKSQNTKLELLKKHLRSRRAGLKLKLNNDSMNEEKLSRIVAQSESSDDQTTSEQFRKSLNLKCASNENKFTRTTNTRLSKTDCGESLNSKSSLTCFDSNNCSPNILGQNDEKTSCISNESFKSNDRIAVSADINVNVDVKTHDPIEEALLLPEQNKSLELIKNHEILNHVQNTKSIHLKSDTVSNSLNDECLNNVHFKKADAKSITLANPIKLQNDSTSNSRLDSNDLTDLQENRTDHGENELEINEKSSDIIYPQSCVNDIIDKENLKSTETNPNDCKQLIPPRIYPVFAPVFNDINFESSEDEWDAHAEFENFDKNSNTESTIELSDTRPRSEPLVDEKILNSDNREHEINESDALTNVSDKNRQNSEPKDICAEKLHRVFDESKLINEKCNEAGVALKSIDSPFLSVSSSNMNKVENISIKSLQDISNCPRSYKKDESLLDISNTTDYSIDASISSNLKPDFNVDSTRIAKSTIELLSEQCCTNVTNANKLCETNAMTLERSRERFEEINISKQDVNEAWKPTGKTKSLCNMIDKLKSKESCTALDISKSEKFEIENNPDGTHLTTKYDAFKNFKIDNTVNAIQSPILCNERISILSEVKRKNLAGWSGCLKNVGDDKNNSSSASDNDYMNLFDIIKSMYTSKK